MWHRVLTSVVALGLLGSAHGLVCPAADPYMAEPSPFGWPLAPGDWEFAHQDCWPEKYMMCGGSMQSPMDIDLKSGCALEKGGARSSLSDSGVAKYISVSENPMVKVSKYMRSAHVDGAFGTLQLIDFKGEPVIYEATQVHLTAPSLHTINGTHYDAEMMVIHKPKGDPDALEEALVVSTLFKISEDPSLGSSVFEQMGFDEGYLLSQSEWTAPMSVDLHEAITPALSGDSYLYNGSMPVPPCSETVNWFVLGSVQPVKTVQVQKLTEVLKKHTGDVDKRPVQKRECRTVAINKLEIGGSHTAASCQAMEAIGASGKSAQCWKQTQECTKSPVNLDSTDPKMGASKNYKMDYKSSSEVSVSPSMYTLDAHVADGHGDFGYMDVNGRTFMAKKISIKPIAAHTIDGVRYDGELMIEHVLFGDTIASATPSATAGHAPAHHRRLSEDDHLHRVMVSVPLKLGSESALLRNLGLGQQVYKQTIRDGSSYITDKPIDISSGLADVFAGDWFWYSGGSVTPTCPSWGVRWMVFKTPLEVNLEQLNFLALPVSGVDSSLMPVPVQPTVKHQWMSSLPEYAVDATTDGDCGVKAWDYANTNCWKTNHSVCSDGARQSPINIVTSDVTEVGDDSFLNRCSWKPVSGVRVANTGYDLQAKTEQFGYITYIGENGFPDYYQVTSVDVHMPSEHQIDGKHFAAELQIVHKLQKSVLELASDDIVVASILFDLGEEDNPVLKQLFLPGAEAMSTLAGPHHGGTYDTVPNAIDLMRAFGPSIDGTFYRYDGSFTMPSCAEVVKWFVFEKPVTMSIAQFQSFKALFSSPANNRPIQPTNGRTIAKNKMMEGTFKEVRFYLNRDLGRDRRSPGEGLILYPIIGCLLLFTFVMFATFVQEDPLRKGESAGGLAETIGTRTPSNRF
mmetsp:Transcript_45797/g.97813  ORF Transcript_45797/g.97813 Transcript_45797/m.97813 type:complete len:909 (-) Transcript_45797:123-2849(-)